MTTTSKKPATSKSSKAPKRAASGSKTAKTSTRTSSRSAKRRSPKEKPEDPAVLEVERLEFLRAMDRYKRKTGKTFPSWTEVLAVLREIGWLHPERARAAIEAAVTSAVTDATRASKR